MEVQWIAISSNVKRPITDRRSRLPVLVGGLVFNLATGLELGRVSIGMP